MCEQYAWSTKRPEFFTALSFDQLLSEIIFYFFEGSGKLEKITNILCAYSSLFYNFFIIYKNRQQNRFNSRESINGEF